MFSVSELVANVVGNDPTLAKKLVAVGLYTNHDRLPHEIKTFLRQPRTQVSPQDHHDFISLLVMWAISGSPFSGGDALLQLDIRDWLSSNVSVAMIASLEGQLLKELSQ